jgi:hypothetical protein
MAVSAPRRAATAPAPARTAPPEPKKRPRDRPKPGAPARKASVAAPARPAPKRKPARKGLGRKASAATAPARKGTARKASAATAPARKPASARASAAAPARTAPARRAPSRKSPGRRAAQGGQLIPIAVGRTAATVRGLPDSGAIVRLTRGRTWIALLGVLLVGIVALNVVTLSFAASSGRIDANATTLEHENSLLGGRKETKYSQERIRHEAAQLGLASSTTQNPHLVVAGKDDVATAAARLAAASPE